MLPKRKPVSNKGTYGHALCICGSMRMTGAACLAVGGALRGGAGLVTAAFPQSAYAGIAPKLTEPLLLPLDSNFEGTFSFNALADIFESSKRATAVLLGCGIGWVCGFTGSGGGILMLTVFTLVLGYNLKVAVGTSTMIMTLVALTGAVSHISLGARIFPLPMAVVVLSCLLGAVVSAKFANRCEIARLNRIVGIVLVLLGIVTIAVKLL